MILFVGLGNIGKEYEKTVHNIGFMLIDYFKSNFSSNIESESEKFKADITKISIFNKKILLVKPRTFVNNSGESVQMIKNFYKIDNKDIYAFYDDIHIETGKIKIKNSQGSAGHNGIKSLESQIGFDFNRIKIGIKNDTKSLDQKDYVLSKISDEKMLKIEKVIHSIASNLELLLSQSENSNALFIEKVLKI